MHKLLLKRTLVAVALCLLAPYGFAQNTFGQSGGVWSNPSQIRAGARGSVIGTVSKTDTSRGIFDLTPDGQTRSVRVTTDALATQYRGFGGTSDIFSGASGFGRLHTGDRVEVSGMGGASYSVSADDVLLLGRGGAGSSGTAIPASPIEGIVRNTPDQETRIVVETDDRQIYTIQGTSTTPVYFQGQSYRISNIEAGDRVRIQIAPANSINDLRARSIDVLTSVSATGATDVDRSTITAVVGRITRMDTRGQTFRVTTDRNVEIPVDARDATDSSGRSLRIADLHVGDRVEVSGRYGSNDVFLASTVRMSSLDTGVRGRDGDDVTTTGDTDLTAVVIYGTVQGDLSDTGKLTVKETSVKETTSSRMFTILVDEDFIVRTRTGTYVTANQLKVGDKVVVKAFRDANRHYIAQTIRTR
ncbi:MAG TPA: DUF5666 domain-containing protein [Thermoanaerobaculia bacterium]|nr:DUF5666 domain-containing protein [Thermoanaerobaculia bacterium]